MLHAFGIRHRLVALVGVIAFTLAACAGAELLVLRTTILQERAVKMHDMVEAVERLIAATDQRVRSEGGTQEQAQLQAAASVRALRWNKGDYYGVYRWDGLTIVHGNHEYEGLNRLSVVDPLGFRLVAGIIEMAKAGGGPVSYSAPRAAGGVPLPKLSHVGRYAPWQWAIQAGVYVDDVNATLRQRALRLFEIGLVILALSSLAIAGVYRSITTYQRQAREAMASEAATMRASEQRFRSLIQNALDIILICDRRGAITYQSSTSKTTWGYSEEELLGRLFRDLVSPNQRLMLEEAWRQAEGAPGAARQIELQMRDGLGEWHHFNVDIANLLDEPSVAGMVVTAHNINERKAFERHLENQAFYDALTGLPNRTLFHKRLDQAVETTIRRETWTALLFIDLDGFKSINDTLGHHAGDQLLSEVARRLQSCVRPEDTVARLGGDEFVVLLEQKNGGADATIVAERIVRQLQQGFTLADQVVAVTASLGVAVSEGPETDAEILLRNADAAMYCAKADGKAQYTVFHPDLHNRTRERLGLEGELRHALDRGEMRLHYQPIVALHSRSIVEVEALLRWQHPTRGLITPAEFIPIAEQTGLIIPLGSWVLAEACRQAASWRAEFKMDPAFAMGVNLSPRQFQNGDLADLVGKTLLETGLPAGCLRLEVTEGVIIRDIEPTIAMMDRLRTLGVRLVLDDFGTGYSSLSYLKRLPVDTLKIDRSFVSGLGEVQEDTTVVRAIISLGKSLGMSVVGEGIETAEQAAWLHAWQCDLGQGYYFGEAMEATALSALLEAEIDVDRDRRAA